MSGILESLSDAERERVESADAPEWIDPQLATLTHEHFSDPAWIFERKLDGERCLAFRRGGKVKLMTRNRKPLNATYPELVEALEGGADAVLDGEIVAFSGKVTSFSRLQRRMQIKDAAKARASDVAVYYYLFDMVHCDGMNLAELPLRTRKKLLRRAIDFADPLRYASHRNEDGEAWLEEACRRGWEGLIAKKADAPYRFDRSRDWLKFKCERGQEFVIAGYTDPEGSRIGFGALLLGYYDGDELRYAGRVGTGFDDELLESLARRLRALETDAPAFADPPEKDGLHWVKPELVGEVSFTEWTGDGKLRHPRFKGLRDDKSPREVVREEARDDA